MVGTVAKAKGVEATTSAAGTAEETSMAADMAVATMATAAMEMITEEALAATVTMAVMIMDGVSVCNTKQYAHSVAGQRLFHSFHVPVAQCIAVSASPNSVTRHPFENEAETLDTIDFNY